MERLALQNDDFHPSRPPPWEKAGYPWEKSTVIRVMANEYVANSHENGAQGLQRVKKRKSSDSFGFVIYQN